MMFFQTLNVFICTRVSKLVESVLGAFHPVANYLMTTAQIVCNHLRKFIEVNIVEVQ